MDWFIVFCLCAFVALGTWYITSEAWEDRYNQMRAEYQRSLEAAQRKDTLK